MVRSLSDLADKAQPTAFHHLIARLAQEGRLLRLYSQNVDGIDTSLPPLATRVPLEPKGPWPRTIQLHGGLNKMVCQKCSETSDFQPDLFQGPIPPLCKACSETDSVRTTIAGKRSHGVGRLRPRIVLYNEHNPDEEAIGSVVTSDLRNRPDALIVAGTSMKIPGVRRIVREMCGVVRGRKDGMTMWINHGPPPSGKEFEDCWDLVVKGSSDDVASEANLKKWDDLSEEPVSISPSQHTECTTSDCERAQKSKPEVLVPSPRKGPQQTKLVQAKILTPADTPVPEETPPAGAPKQKVTNPASRGRSLNQVLNGQGQANPVKKKAARKKTAPQTKTEPVNNRFKVTKSAKQTTAVKKEDSKEVSVTPINQVNRQAARSNGPPNLFPNLLQPRKDNSLSKRENSSPDPLQDYCSLNDGRPSSAISNPHGIPRLLNPTT